MIATSSHKPCYIVYKNSLSMGLRENLLYYIFYVRYQVLASEKISEKVIHGVMYPTTQLSIRGEKPGTCKMLLKASHGTRKKSTKRCFFIPPAVAFIHFFAGNKDTIKKLKTFN